MEELENFKKSTDKLVEFLNKWAGPLSERCEKNNSSSQQKASYYLWLRYSMSIKTIKQICSIEFFPDLCVIGRCCLEISASLQAVLSDEQVAQDYLEFEKHSKSNHYRKFLKKSDDYERISQAEEHLNKIGVKNPDNYKKKCWYKYGYAQLVETYKGEKDRELYFFLSDYVHSSINAFKITKDMRSCQKLLEKTIKLVYSDYIILTKSFLDNVWDEIIIGDRDKCENEFIEIAKLNY